MTTSWTPINLPRIVDEVKGSNIMSAKENSTAAAGAEGAEGGIPDVDAKFLIACLQNTTGGSVSIDSLKVATLLGYKNHRSINNRVALMKKKYGLPISCSAAKAGEETGEDASTLPGPADAKVPATPGKKRVTKARTTPAKPRGKGKAKVEVENAGEDNVKQDGSDGNVKSEGSGDEGAEDEET